MKLIERLIGCTLSEVEIDLLKDDNDAIWLLDVREVVLHEDEGKSKKRSVKFKVSLNYISVQVATASSIKRVS